MKRLIIVENRQEAGIAAQWLKGKDAADNLILSLSEDAKEYLEARGLEPKTEQDYLKHADCADIIKDGWNRAMMKKEKKDSSPG